MILIFIMNALLALLFTIDKQLLFFLPPMTFLAARTLVCGFLFGGYFFATEWGKFKITLTDVATALLLSFFNLYLANVFFLTSLKTLTSAKASLLYNSKPFVVAILAYLFLNDTFSWKKTLGLVIGWIGFVQVLVFDNPISEGIFRMSRGEIFALGAAVSVAISYLLFYHLMKTKKAPVAFTSTINMLATGVLSLINVYFTESSPAILNTIVINHYSSALFAGAVLVTMTWATSFTYLTGKYPSSFLAATSFIMPIFAAFFEWVFFGRLVNYTFSITVACVAIGLGLIYQAEKNSLNRIELPEIEMD